MKIINKLIVAAILFASCKNNPKDPNQSHDYRSQKYSLADKKDFEGNVDGKKTGLYYLKNNGIEAAITSYGGRIVNLLITDKKNQKIDVIVGPSSLKEFEDSKEPYYGATIGRYGNRIAKGKFSLGGHQYSVPLNNGQNALHGGVYGFQRVVWDAVQESDSALTLHYLAKEDGKEGFPGNLDVTVTYTLTGDTTMRIDYKATTDKLTVCNLTNHAFYNMNGYLGGSIYNNILKINASKYTPVDSTLIPLGHNDKVSGTPFDFTTAHKIGDHIDDTTNTQLVNGKGYDHNYVLDINKNDSLTEAAYIKGDKSGISMTIYTMEPGIQFYTGNFMQSLNKVKGGGLDEHRTAVALEPQHFPDSPNQPAFPTTQLKPGDVYRTTSLYKFSLK